MAIAATVRTLMRHYRQAEEAEELSREARQRADRMLLLESRRLHVLKAPLPAETGALLVKALEAAVKER